MKDLKHEIEKNRVLWKKNEKRLGILEESLVSMEAMINRMWDWFQNAIEEDSISESGNTKTDRSGRSRASCTS